jgi:hypothetical protein
MCTTTEDGILVPQLLNLMGGGGGTHLVCGQMGMLLHIHPSSVLLEVEQVLHVPGQQSHPGMEVRALEVGHGPKALLPYGALLILNQVKCDRQRCHNGEAVLAQGGEGDVRHHLNVGVGLTVNDGLRPWLCGVECYRHADLTPVQVVGLGQSATIDRSIPNIAKTDECVV